MEGYVESSDTRRKALRVNSLGTGNGPSRYNVEYNNIIYCSLFWFWGGLVNWSLIMRLPACAWGPGC